MSSRRALEKITARNSCRTVSEIISAFTSTRVIDTPMRTVEVLESNSGEIILRCTEYTGARADVTLIHFDYHEAYALGSVLRNLEAPDDESPKKGNGRV